MLFQRPVKSWLQDLRQPVKFMELYDCLYMYLREDAANGRYRGAREPYVFHVVPDTLLRTCRLARIVRMERWKKEVEGIPVLKRVEGAGVLVPKLKAEITEGLNREIKTLKDGV